MGGDTITMVAAQSKRADDSLTAGGCPFCWHYHHHHHHQASLDIIRHPSVLDDERETLIEVVVTKPDDTVNVILFHMQSVDLVTHVETPNE